MRIALYQPDIPQNTGAAIRLCACMGVGLDIIEPCGFLWSERKMDRSAMDYKHMADLTRHMNWDSFKSTHKGARIILMTTKSSVPYTQFEFQENDILLAGQESCGVPPEIDAAADGRILIPMHGQARSLNVINAASMILGEALRQTRT